MGCNHFGEVEWIKSRVMCSGRLAGRGRTRWDGVAVPRVGWWPKAGPTGHPARLAYPRFRLGA